MTTPKDRFADTSDSERLQKIIAQAGLASRREAEEWIAEGLVTVNGEVAKLGDKANLSKDAIKVKGKLLHTTAHKVYYVFYKPKNVIAMISEDEEGRVTIKDIIHKRIKERVFTVGRMDFTGEGAILLTNDGELSQKLLKSTDIIRRYHVKVDRLPTQEELARLARGGRIEGRSMNPFHVRVAQAFSRNSLIEISFEGMGSLDVRKFFENKGFFPEKVARVGIGHINAEKLAPGDFKKLDASSVQALLGQPELAKKQIERIVQKKTKIRVLGEEEQAEKESARRERKAEDAPRKTFGTRSTTRPARPSTLRPAIRSNDDSATTTPRRRTFGEKTSASGAYGSRTSSNRSERAFGATAGKTDSRIRPAAARSERPSKTTVRFKRDR